MIDFHVAFQKVAVTNSMKKAKSVYNQYTVGTLLEPVTKCEVFLQVTLLP